MLVEKLLSLVLLRKNGSVLLGWKKRGFGAGKWNGFGGKLEEGETMLECAKRQDKLDIILLALKFKLRNFNIMQTKTSCKKILKIMTHIPLCFI